MIIKRMLAVVAAVLTVSQAAYAQNYTKFVDKQVDTKTIVRVVNEIDRVVYVENNTENKRVFLNYTDTVTNPYLVGIQLPQYKKCEYYVNDFVVYEKTIYFCGYKIHVTTGDTSGIFGCIVNPESLSNVSYCDVPGTLMMRKIQVFKDAGQPHVVMVGDKNSKTSILVEALTYSTNVWTMVTSTDSKVGGNYYDDLTVTDSNVVAVSRNRYGIHSAYVHLFNRPNSYASFILMGARYFGTNYYAFGPIMVEHRAGKEYATVTNILGENGYYYSCYSGENHIASSIYQNLNECTLYDIRYNRLTKKMDVLSRNTWQGSTHYEIIHHRTNGSAVITSHINNEDAIRSLDYIENTGDMVASGFFLLGTNYLLLYKYQPENYNCFTMRMPYGEDIANPYDPQDEKFSGSFYTQRSIKTEPILVIYSISTVCE